MLESLKYVPPTTVKPKLEYETTKAGAPIFFGDAASFEDWKFKVSILQKGTKPDDKASCVTKIIEGLRDDAFTTAKDLGEKALYQENGVTLLIETIEKKLFPKRLQEALKMYKQGHLVTGPLDRQPGEQFDSFFKRRRQWYTKLKDLNSEIVIPMVLQAELALDHAGITQSQRQYVQTHMNTMTFVQENPTLLDKLEATFIDLFPNVKTMTTGLKGDGAPKKPFTKHGGKPPFKKKFFKGHKGKVHMSLGDDGEEVADDESHDDHQEGDELYEGDDDPSAFMAGDSGTAHEDDEDDDATSYYTADEGWLEGDDIESPEQVHLETLNAFIIDGFDDQQQEQLDDLAQVAQANAISFYAKKGSKGKGKGKRNRGKASFRKGFKKRDHIRILSRLIARPSSSRSRHEPVAGTVAAKVIGPVTRSVLRSPRTAHTLQPWNETPNDRHMTVISVPAVRVAKLSCSWTKQRRRFAHAHNTSHMLRPQIVMNLLTLTPNCLRAMKTRRL